jgi:hypothetical protein
VGVVALLPPQADIETARVKASVRRFMRLESFVFDVKLLTRGNELRMGPKSITRSQRKPQRKPLYTPWSKTL